MATGDSASVQAAGGRSLRHVRAAQLRARATRQAIIQMLLGTVFLIGALSYALAPDKHAQVNLAWMAGLLVLSTLDAALGLRALVRLRMRRKNVWVWKVATGAWALLSIVVVAVLLRG
jgi:imidazolonepropionase-like amidohydrolase